MDSILLCKPYNGYVIYYFLKSPLSNVKTNFCYFRIWQFTLNTEQFLDLNKSKKFT